MSRNRRWKWYEPSVGIASRTADRQDLRAHVGSPAVVELCIDEPPRGRLLVVVAGVERHRAGERGVVPGVDRRVGPPGVLGVGEGPRVAGLDARLPVIAEPQRHPEGQGRLREQPAVQAAREVVVAVVALEEKRGPADLRVREGPALDRPQLAVRAAVRPRRPAERPSGPPSSRCSRACSVRPRPRCPRCGRSRAHPAARRNPRARARRTPVRAPRGVPRCG